MEEFTPTETSTSVIEINSNQDLKTHRVLVEREGKAIEVLVDVQDFREQQNLGQTNMFITGFGLRKEGGMGNLEKKLTEESEDLKARYVRVSINDIPPGYDNEHSDRSLPPSSDVDARIIMEAVEKAGVSHLEENPVVITGYSEGAVVAISVAGEIQKRQEHLHRPPQNTLRLWSLTGVVEMADQPTGLTAPLRFAKEVGSIGLTQIAKKYNEVRFDGRPPVTSLRNMSDALMLAGNLGAMLASKEGRQRIAAKWKEAQEGDLDMLQSVIQRIINNPRAAIDQFKKFECRNPVCDSLGTNWNVIITTPRQDTLFPWSRAKKILAANNERVIVEIPQSEVSENNSPQPLSYRKRLDLRWKKLFPNVGTVIFKPVGSKDLVDVARTHIGPANNPDLFIQAAPLQKART